MKAAFGLVLGLALWGTRGFAGDPPSLPLIPGDTVIAVNQGTVAPATQQGAALLQQWLRRACGVSNGFAIVGETNAVGAKAILAVGPTRWADTNRLASLADNGYLIRRTDNVVSIAGPGSGAFYGAAAFLDRVCGVRFYMPGDLFTSLPREAKVTVGAIDLVSAPYVKSCFMTGLGMVPGDHDWANRNGALRRLGGSHQHSMFTAFPPDRYATNYPEIYPIINGTRYIPKNGSDQKWQPCFSEPKLVDAAEATALDYFQKNPGHLYLAYSVQDGHTFCQCPRCQEQVTKLGLTTAQSRLYWTFMNALAKRFQAKLPGKLVLGMAYSEVREAPPFPLESNIVVFLNVHEADLLVNHTLEPDEKGVVPVDAWLKTAKLLGNHEWAEGMMFLIPRVYPGLEQTFTRYCRQHGSDLVFRHAEEYPHWGLDAIKPYLTAKLWWNPDTDIAATWRQFSDDMFGPAADPMCEYFTSLEPFWVKLNGDTKRKLRGWDTQFKTDEADRATIKRLRSLLDKAQTLARTPEEKQRIELFSKSFRLSERFFEIPTLDKLEPALIADVKRYAREVLMPDPMTFYRANTNGQSFLEFIDAALTSCPLSKQFKITPRLENFKHAGNGAVAWDELWDAQQGTMIDLSLFVHCYDKTGKIAFQADHAVTPGTSAWNSTYRFPVALTVPAGADGDYQIGVGLGNLNPFYTITLTGPRVPGITWCNSYWLGTLTVKRADGKISDVVFTPPAK